MPKYAAFDPNTGHVNGWYDTDVIRYPRLPPNLREVPRHIWDQRVGSAWRLEGSAFIKRPKTTRPLTVAQQAARTLGTGVVITSAANPSLDGIYAATDAAWSAMTTEAHILQDKVDWVDTSGKHHSFSADEFAAFAAAIARWRSDWRKYAEGLTKEPPASSIELD